MQVQYPKDEKVWVSYFDVDHKLHFIITSKVARDFYFLYELRNGKFVKVSKNKNPVALEEKIAEKLEK